MVLWASASGRVPDSFGGQVLTATIGLVAAGVLLVRRGLRPLASEALIGDAPTILYLRSFAKDGEGRRLGDHCIVGKSPKGDAAAYLPISSWCGLRSDLGTVISEPVGGR